MKPAPAPPELAQAQACWQRGDLAGAVALCKRLLQVQAQHAGALQMLTLLLQQQGQVGQAAQTARQWVRVSPADGPAHTALGAALQRLGDLDGAVRAWQQALRLPGPHADLHYRLARVWLDAGDDAAALAELVAAQCDGVVHEDALLLQITLLHRLQRPDEARQLLGDALFRLTRSGVTDRVLALWLTLFPQDEAPQHRLAAQGLAGAPPRAAEAYLSYLFDRYAASFDEDLGRLQYQVPALIAQRLTACLPPPRAAWQVLDAGCGTGLCAPVVRAYAQRLTGVDVSAGMLARAAKRGCYDQLVQAELTDFLVRSPERFELMVSADTLNYFGELEPVLTGMARVLAAGGWLVFSLELQPQADTSPWSLGRCGRYQHSVAYTRQVLDAAGLRLTDTTPAVLRMNDGQPVQGLIISCCSP